jgi:hypothetical protein
LLSWHRRVWVFDHGVAFPFHFSGDDPRAAAGAPCPEIASHVLLAGARDLERAGDEARARLGRAVIEEIVASVPSAWLEPEGRTTMLEAAAPITSRDDYAAFLEARLARSAEFVAEVNAARANLRP